MKESKQNDKQKCIANVTNIKQISFVDKWYLIEDLFRQKGLELIKASLRLRIIRGHAILSLIYDFIKLSIKIQIC